MNEIPGIINIFDGINPTLISPTSPFSLPFYQTRQTLEDPELYQNFLQNAVREFRKTRVYTHYKSFLMELGMDRCQLNSNLTSDMVTLEMHHNVLTIFDIALILCEWLLATTGYVTTFDLIYLLRQEHTNHRVQLVMLNITKHQQYHNTDDIFIHPSMCFGKWWEFLELYNRGITKEIAKKLIFYINESMRVEGSTDGELSKLREKIKDWSEYNDQFTRVPTTNSNII